MKIVILDGNALNPGDLSWDKFKNLGEVTLYKHTEAADVVERIGDADVVLINKIDMSKDVISKCPNLKYIGVQATGYNVVDIDAAKERGIVVTNIPAYSTDAVAQSAFALLLEITQQVGHHNRRVKEGRWSECETFCFWETPLFELKNKTMGIFGYGNIGKKTAEIAKAFGMNVIVHSRTKKEGCENVSLDELLKKSDIISLHAPLTKETTRIIDRVAISKMKKSAILINTSRGALIDEEALKDALNNDNIYAAGVDVASIEPINKDNPLLTAKNIFITPHIAWAPYETRERAINMVYDNLEAYQKGKTINKVS